MAFRTRFERAYGFELLDDLHNFFPELMYDDEIMNNEMAAYMRHRVRTLFPSAYMRNENIYNIYERVNRRRAYAAWRQSFLPPSVPPVPPPPRDAEIPVVAPVAADISGAEVPVLGTPPPTRRLLGINTLGGYRRPERNQVSWFASSFPIDLPQQQTMEPIPLLFPEDNTLTTGLLNLLNIGLTGTGAGAGAGAGAGFGALFQDVVVAPTNEQVEAGSEIRRADQVSADSVCAICMEHTSESPENNDWRVLRCSHMYHTTCIGTWFQNHVACPVCRTDIRTYTQRT